MSNYLGGQAGGNWAQYPIHLDAEGKPVYPPGSSPPVELLGDDHMNIHEIGSDVTSASPPASTPMHDHSGQQ
jgi:hypothetical protein